MAESIDDAPEPVKAVQGQVVLLVDYNDAAREAMAEWLQELGYRVLEVTDAPAAPNVVNGGARVDMLVTDVGLPNELNGIRSLTPCSNGMH